MICDVVFNLAISLIAIFSVLCCLLIGIAIIDYVNKEK